MPDMKKLVIGNDEYTVVDADAQDRIGVLESAKIHKYVGTLTNVAANSTKSGSYRTDIEGNTIGFPVGDNVSDYIWFIREIEIDNNMVYYQQLANPDDNIVYPAIQYNTNSGYVTVEVWNNTDSARDISFELLFAKIV